MHTKGARVILTVIECLVVVAASVVAAVSYGELVLGASVLAAHWAIGLLAAVLYGGVMYAIEADQRLRKINGMEALRDATFVWLATIMLITFFAFSVKAGAEFSRGAILSFTLLGLIGIMWTRAIAPRAITKLYDFTRLNGSEILVVGGNDNPALSTLLSELKAVGYTAPQVVTVDANCSSRDWRDKLDGSLRRIMAVTRTTSHAEICIAADGFSDDRLKDVVAALQVVPSAVRIVPSSSLEQFLHLPIYSIGALRSIEVQKAPLNAVQRATKRAMDVVLASAMLAFLAPPLLLVAALIRLDSRGPVLFKQTRLGYRGQPFAIFKFRTMSVTENGPEIRQAQANDQRVTRVGRWLRRLSIDELPQLINVIRGEMSMVGPRPHAVAHDNLYSSLIGNYEIRQHVKPGITGWAQVNGLRGPTPSTDLMRKRVEFDIWYATNASIWVDVKILMLTVVEVCRQRNAF